MTEKVCFELLQVAIGNRKSLSVGISDADWHRLFDFCKRQALAGIGFYAVERLHQQGIECPVSLKMKWMAMTLQIEKQNGKLNRQCKELTERLEHDGLHCCILKGQGNLLNYPKHLKLKRNPGDIDIWCATSAEGLPIAVQTSKDRVGYMTYYGRRGIIEYVRMQHRLAGNNYKHHITYHHIDAPNYEGTPIEIHFRPAHLYSPYRNWNLQRWFKKNTIACMNNRTQIGFSIPTSSINVVFQMTHIYKHHIDGGVGFRQLMDYYFALKAWKNNYGLSAKADEESLNYKCFERSPRQKQDMWTEGLGVPVTSKDVMGVLRSFGMGNFSAAVMWVLHEVFAMPTHYNICEPNEKEGRKLLAEIMRGGNFGLHGKERPNVYEHRIKYHIWKFKRLFRLFVSYPEEALCEPFFRIWYWGWRLFH